MAAEGGSASQNIEIDIINFNGELILRASCLPSDPVRHLKQMVTEAGGQSPYHQKLFFGQKELVDDQELAGQGVQSSNDMISLVWIDPPEAFHWGTFGGNCTINLPDAPGLLVKGCTAETVGVRAQLPLPRNATWKVVISKSGTHASVGVATSECTLQSGKYVYLAEGQDSMWCLCVNTGGELRTMHGQDCRLLDVRANAQPFEVQLSISNGTVLSVCLPGEEQPRVLFSDLPYSRGLYAAATAVAGDCSVSIERLSP